MPEHLKLQFQITLNDWLEFKGKEPDSSDRKAEEEWKRQLANVDCTVELTDNGFQYISGSSTYNPTWAEVGTVFQSEHLLIVCDDDIEYALLIPKRSFTSEEQLHEFLEIAYQKTVVEKSGEVM